MLILTVKPKKSFLIGNDIEVFIFGNHDNDTRAVKVGIVAPPEIKILRSELKNKKSKSEILNKKIED